MDSHTRSTGRSRWKLERGRDRVLVGSAVVNLDGLVNNAKYYRRAIRGTELPRYVDEVGITWLADQACRDGDLEPYLARSNGQELQGRLLLRAHFYRNGQGVPATEFGC